MTAAENTARLGGEDVSSRSAAAARVTAFGVLFAASGSHMLNDMMQSLAPALYPVFRDQLSLTFFQTGIITFTFQLTASLLQPLVGIYTDHRPQPFSLAAGCAASHSQSTKPSPASGFTVK